MNEFIGKFEEAISANDLMEAERLIIKFIYPAFSKSLLKELTGTAYFPSLNPEFSENFDHEKPWNELREEAIRRIQDNPNLIFSSNIEGISEITDYKFITLFEAALLIGERIEKEPRMLIATCPEMFLDAIIKKQIDPREPLTHIPYRKLHKSPTLINGDVFFHRQIPDLSWTLTLKEVAEFAIFKGYPESAFSDLLSEKPTKELQVTTQNDNTKLFEIIGLLAETLADTNPGDLRKPSGAIVLGNGEKGSTDKTNLLHEISMTLDRLNESKGVKSYGLGDGTIGPLIKKGIEALKLR